MLTSTRHAEILRRLHTSGEVSVQDLADTFEVSTSTIRRDLDQLSAEGLLRRVRGGGASVEDDVLPVAEVAALRTDERDAIGKLAADLVPQGAVVLMDIGATTARVARHLRGRRLTLITSSLEAVKEVEDDEGIEVVVLGGVLRRNYRSLVGALTEQALGQLRAHICFLSTSGVRGDGQVMDDTGIEVPVKRAMIAAADKVVLVADSSKFPGTALLPVCGPEQVHTLVTTTGADPSIVAAFTSAGTEVLTA